MIHCIVIGFHKWSRVEPLMRQLTSMATDQIEVHFADNLGDEEIHKQLSMLPYTNYYCFDNLGYGNAVNQILRSNHWNVDSLFIVMNDDAIFMGNGFNILAQTFKKIIVHNGNVGVVSPTFVATDSTKDSSRYFQLSNTKKENYSEMLFGPAACWMFDYAFLKKVGGFYPGFFMYGEDTELLNRATYYGLKH